MTDRATQVNPVSTKSVEYQQDYSIRTLHASISADRTPNGGDESLEELVGRISAYETVEPSRLRRMAFLAQAVRGVPITGDWEFRPADPWSYEFDNLLTLLMGEHRVTPVIDAGEVISGLLPISRGGTNNDTYTTDEFISYDGVDSLVSSGYSPSSFSLSGHTHDAGDIVSGILPESRGGTNNSSFTAAKFIYDNGASTLISSPYGASDFAAASHVHSAADITSGLLALARGGTYNDTFTSGKFIAYDGVDSLDSTAYDSSSFAAASHQHAASDITSGLLPIARGGTNNDTFTDGELIEYSLSGTDLISSGYSQSEFLLLDGTRPMTGVLDMGGYYIKGLSALQGTFDHTILAMTDDASALYHLLIVAGTAGDPNVTLRPAGGTNIGLVLDPAGTSHISLNGKTDVTDDLTIAAAGRLVCTDSASSPPLNITERGTAPTTPSTGDIYLDNGTNYNSGGGLPGFMRWTGSAWEDIGNDGGGGGGGAPTTAQYVTLATDATLTAERVLTAGTGISLTDGGAGSTITVATSGVVLDTDFTGAGALLSASAASTPLILAKGTNGYYLTVDDTQSTKLKWIALDITDDPAPALGGDLDVDGNNIQTNSTNKDMQFKCNTSGQIYVQAKHWEIGRITGAMPVDNASGNGAYGQAYVGGGSPACVHRGFIFNDSTDYYLDLSGILHYDYNLTDPIDWHLMVAAVSAASGTIEMKITVAPVGGGTTDLDNNIFSSSTEVAGTATVSSAGKVEEIIIALSNSQMASIAGGSCFVARIRRNSSVSGDVTGDVILFPQFCRVCCGTSAT